MGTHSENESWIVNVGDVVIEKKAELGDDRLSPVDRLVYCLWVADYGMRNAGDLDTANDLYPLFQREAADLAKQLALVFTHESFSLPTKILHREYFERFDRICDEIKDVAR